MKWLLAGWIVYSGGFFQPPPPPDRPGVVMAEQGFIMTAAPVALLTESAAECEAVLTRLRRLSSKSAMRCEPLE